jgi:hypothetical protein
MAQFIECPSPNEFSYPADLIDHIYYHALGTSYAINEVKSNNREDTMRTSQISRKPHQGPCSCDDCGKQLQWKGIDWCITNNGYLLCSSCMLTWVRENRYHKERREESTSLRKLTVVA